MSFTEFKRVGLKSLNLVPEFIRKAVSPESAYERASKTLAQRLSPYITGTPPGESRFLRLEMGSRMRDVGHKDYTDSWLGTIAYISQPHIIRLMRPQSEATGNNTPVIVSDISYRETDQDHRFERKQIALIFDPATGQVTHIKHSTETITASDLFIPLSGWAIPSFDDTHLAGNIKDLKLKATLLNKVAHKIAE